MHPHLADLSSTAAEPAPAAVVFDIDGTLTTGSFAQVYAIGNTGERVYRLRVETVLLDGQPYLDGHHVAGWVDGQCLELIAELAGHSWADTQDQALEVYGEEYAKVISGGAAVGELVPGVPDMLTHLAAAGVPVGLSTGNSAAVALRKLGALGIADFFDFDPNAGFGDRHPARPYVAAAAVAALPPARAVYLVGDTPADMHAALKARVHGVGVLTGTATAGELFEAGAQTVMPDVTGLVGLLGLPH